MSETPTPATLSAERLAEIREDSDVALYWIGGQRYPTDDMAARAVNAVPELLAHLAARESWFTTRDKELCEAFDAREAAFTEALKDLLMPVRPDQGRPETLQDWWEEGRQQANEDHNAAIQNLAASLGLDLT